MQEKSIAIEKLPPVLTVARVAALAQVSRRTVREWVRTGRLEARREPPDTPSGRLYFDTAEVLRAFGVRVQDGEA